jgi:hypothetical protein
MPLLPEPQVAGRHVRDDDSVDDLLSTTLLDWVPQETSTRLRKRDFRWTTILLITLVVGGLAAGGFWLWQRPARLASQAVAEVEDDAAALVTALDETRPVAEQLATGETVPGYTEILNGTEAEARDLFAASAALEQGDPTRTAVADEASAVLDYTGRLNAAIAFRSALQPALVLPEFDADPASADLATAAAEFGEWRAYLDEVAGALPDGVDAALVSAFNDLRLSLGTAQSLYLDGIREDDAAAVGFVLRRVESDLETLNGEIQQSFEGLAGELLSQIEETQGGLLRLFG